MRITLIGGAGFIGHHLALRLLGEGHDVHIVDNLCVNNLEALNQADAPPEYRAMVWQRFDLFRKAGAQFSPVDARNYSDLARTMAAFEPDAVVHLAAMAHIDRANKDPMSTFDHCSRTLENALDVSSSLGIKHFVFFSSSTVYGDFLSSTVDEESACRPRGFYGSLKYAGELTTRSYGDVKDLPWTIVRPCALYGPRCVSGRVTQKFLEAAYWGRKLFVEGDGSGRHDFTFIEDLLAGVTAVINQRPIGEVFNLTADEARSLMDVIRALERFYPLLNIEYRAADPQKPSRGRLSCDKARKMLGYAPEWPIERGIEAYAKWYANFQKELRDATKKEYEQESVLTER